MASINTMWRFGNHTSHKKYYKSEVYIVNRCLVFSAGLGTTLVFFWKNPDIRMRWYKLILFQFGLLTPPGVNRSPEDGPITEEQTVENPIKDDAPTDLIKNKKANARLLSIKLVDMGLGEQCPTIRPECVPDHQINTIITSTATTTTTDTDIGVGDLHSL